MASYLDVCRFIPTAGGTTDWTVSSAVTGFQTPASANAVNGTTYAYRAESADLTQWEVGTGVYTTATTVLSRVTVLFNSSGTTSKIDFSSAPQVAVVALAEDVPGLALGNTFSTAQAITSASSAGGQINVSGQTSVSVANTASAIVSPAASAPCYLMVIFETNIAGYNGVFLCSGGNQPGVVFSSNVSFVSGVAVAGKISLGWDGTQFRIYNNLGAGPAVFRFFTVKIAP